MDREVTTQALLVADRVARKFARNLRVDADDMRQAALTAIVGRVNASGYDPERGELGAYLYGTAHRAAAIEATYQRAPVTAKHRREVLYTLRSTSDEVLGSHVDETPTPEDEVCRAAAIAAVKARLTELLGERGAVVFLALADGQTTAEAYARDCKVSTDEVSKAIARGRAAIARDPEMHRLWLELR